MVYYHHSEENKDIQVGMALEKLHPKPKLVSREREREKDPQLNVGF